MLYYWQIAAQYAETGTMPGHVSIIPLGVLLLFGVVFTYGLWQDYKKKRRINNAKY